MQYIYGSCRDVIEKRIGQRDGSERPVIVHPPGGRIPGASIDRRRVQEGNVIVLSIIIIAAVTHEYNISFQLLSLLLSFFSMNEIQKLP